MNPLMIIKRGRDEDHAGIVVEGVELSITRQKVNEIIEALQAWRFGGKETRIEWQEV
jgi:hypothetical protein